MADVTLAEFKTTDTIFNQTFVAGSLTGSAVNAAANAVRLFQTTFPIRVVAMTVYTGTGTVSTTTFTAAYGADAATSSTVFTTTIGSALAAVASTSNSLPITCVSATDTTPAHIVPAGSFVGFNMSAVTSNAVTITGVSVRYRAA